MPKTAYSPDTGELIVTNKPGDWMALTDLVPPVFNSATQGCFFREGAWVIVDAAIAPDHPSFSEVKSAFIVRVDADADLIYAAALGNREAEYKQAEDEATVFKAASYGGTVPLYVHAWAAAKGKSAQWAADDILSTAAAWRTAQAAIRTNRLACKEAARSATTAEELAPIVTQWNGFVVAITAQLKTP